MLLTVVHNKNNLTFSFDPTDNITIAQVKHIIAPALNCYPENLRLIHSNTKLKDDEQLFNALPSTYRNEITIIAVIVPIVCSDHSALNE